jgi:hypothetical protein
LTSGAGLGSNKDDIKADRRLGYVFFAVYSKSLLNSHGMGILLAEGLEGLSITTSSLGSRSGLDIDGTFYI